MTTVSPAPVSLVSAAGSVDIDVSQTSGSLTVSLESSGSLLWAQTILAPAVILFLSGGLHVSLCLPLLACVVCSPLWKSTFMQSPCMMSLISLVAPLDCACELHRSPGPDQVRVQQREHREHQPVLPRCVALGVTFMHVSNVTRVVGAV